MGPAAHTPGPITRSDRPGWASAPPMLALPPLPRPPGQPPDPTTAWASLGRGPPSWCLGRQQDSVTDSSSDSAATGVKLVPSLRAVAPHAFAGKTTRRRGWPTPPSPSFQACAGVNLPLVPKGSAGLASGQHSRSALFWCLGPGPGPLKNPLRTGPLAGSSALCGPRALRSALGGPRGAHASWRCLPLLLLPDAISHEL